MRACVCACSSPTRQAGIPQERQEEGDFSSVCFGYRAPEAKPPTARRRDGKRRHVAFGTPNLFCRDVSLPRPGALLNHRVATRKSCDKSHCSPADRQLLVLPSLPPLPLAHHRRHCQPTVGSSLPLSLQPRRVSSATFTPPTKLRVAQTQLPQWTTVCGSVYICEAYGNYGWLSFSLNCTSPLHPRCALSVYSLSLASRYQLNRCQRARPVLQSRLSSANFCVLLAT